MSAEQVPPALPGEVWRGTVGKYLCAVADPSTERVPETPGGEGLWCRVPDIWGRTHLDRWEQAEEWQWVDILRAAFATARVGADAAEKRCRRLALELDRAAGFVENAADIIEADQGDIDEECAAARSEAAAWRTLAMEAP